MSNKKERENGRSHCEVAIQRNVAPRGSGEEKITGFKPEWQEGCPCSEQDIENTRRGRSL